MVWCQAIVTSFTNCSGERGSRRRRSVAWCYGRLEAAIVQYQRIAYCWWAIQRKLDDLILGRTTKVFLMISRKKKVFGFCTNIFFYSTLTFVLIHIFSLIFVFHPGWIRCESSLATSVGWRLVVLEHSHHSLAAYRYSSNTALFNCYIICHWKILFLCILKDLCLLYYIHFCLYLSWNIETCKLRILNLVVI